MLSSGKRLKDKHIEIGKREIEEVPLVESAPRYTGSDVEDPRPSGWSAVRRSRRLTKADDGAVVVLDGGAAARVDGHGLQPAQGAV